MARGSARIIFKLMPTILCEKVSFSSADCRSAHAVDFWSLLAVIEVCGGSGLGQTHRGQGAEVRSCQQEKAKHFGERPVAENRGRNEGMVKRSGVRRESPEGDIDWNIYRELGGGGGEAGED